MSKKKTIPKLSEDAPVYLVVVDNTEEFSVALRYICGVAKSNGARLATLYVMEREEMQTWLGIAQQIHEEYVNEAEILLNKACKIIKEENGQVPTVYLEEGGRPDVIIDVINNDPSITHLVLGGDTSSSSPGPLVSYFTGKGLSKLRVPLTIVPGNMKI